MKWISILTHPVLVLTLFCLILISGEHIGGFYAMYILMALPHGGVHAIFALVGAALILFSYWKYKGASKYLIDPLMNVIGVFLLYFSLWLFFFSTWEYNDATFQQVAPVASLILFVLVSLGFLLRSIAGFAKGKPRSRNVLT